MGIHKNGDVRQTYRETYPETYPETFASAPLTTREDVETVFCRAPSGGDDEGKELMRMRANFSAVAVELYMFV